MLSFVVPAHNEREHIAACVKSILQYAPPSERVEVVVVNNRSSDDTGVLAAAAGARVLDSSATTIGAVRNEGVRASSGDLLVFLDGDCILTAEWAARIQPVLDLVRTDVPTLAGSHPIPPRDEPVFLWRYWFIPFFQQDGTSHIGSAHMICRRDAFLSAGGFDERLATGEDFELCTRFERRGGRVEVRSELIVEHFGFPRTVRQFIRRERWHGRGDVSSWRAFLGSRVAVLSIAFTGSVLLAVLALTLARPAPAALAAASAAAIVIGASAFRFRHAGVGAQVIATGIFPLYLFGRSLAVLDAVFRRRR